MDRPSEKQKGALAGALRETQISSNNHQSNHTECLDQGNWASLGTASYRVIKKTAAKQASFAEALRRSGLRGRDWGDAFVDLTPAEVAEAREQARGRSKVEAALLLKNGVVCR